MTSRLNNFRMCGMDYGTYIHVSTLFSFFFLDFLIFGDVVGC